MHKSTLPLSKTGISIQERCCAMCLKLTLANVCTSEPQALPSGGQMCTMSSVHITIGKQGRLTLVSCLLWGRGGTVTLPPCSGRHVRWFYRTAVPSRQNLSQWSLVGAAVLKLNSLGSTWTTLWVLKGFHRFCVDSGFYRTTTLSGVVTVCGVSATRNPMMHYGVQGLCNASGRVKRTMK